MHSINDDSIIKMNGTPETNLVQIPTKLTVKGTTTINSTLPAGTYTVSAQNITTEGSGTTFLIMFYYTGGGSKELNLSSTNKTRSVELTNTINRIVVYSQESFNASTDVTTTYTLLKIEV